MNAKDMYRKLHNKLIDQACEKGSFLIAIRGAEARGMSGGVTNQSFTLDTTLKTWMERGPRSH
jgi:hypothetical protein